MVEMANSHAAYSHALLEFTTLGLPENSEYGINGRYQEDIPNQIQQYYDPVNEAGNLPHDTWYDGQSSLKPLASPFRPVAYPTQEWYGDGYYTDSQYTDSPLMDPSVPVDYDEYWVPPPTSTTTSIFELSPMIAPLQSSPTGTSPYSPQAVPPPSQHEQYHARIGPPFNVNDPNFQGLLGAPGLLALHGSQALQGPNSQSPHGLGLTNLGSLGSSLPGPVRGVPSVLTPAPTPGAPTPGTMTSPSWTSATATSSSSRRTIAWTLDEEDRLQEFVDQGVKWQEIFPEFPNRTSAAIKKHYYADMKGHTWTEQEDAQLLGAYRDDEDFKWKRVSEKLGKPPRACERRFRQILKSRRQHGELGDNGRR